LGVDSIAVLGSSGIEEGGEESGDRIQRRVRATRVMESTTRSSTIETHEHLTEDIMQIVKRWHARLWSVCISRV